MSGLIPATKPRGRKLDDGHAYVCSVPDCGYEFASDTKAQVSRAAASHRVQHRSSLRSGGGPQLTVFDALADTTTDHQEKP